MSTSAFIAIQILGWAVVACLCVVIHLRRKLSLEKDKHAKQVKSLSDELVSSYRYNSVAERRFNIARTALGAVATQNEGDQYFKIWAKKMAQDALDRTR